MPEARAFLRVVVQRVPATSVSSTRSGNSRSAELNFQAIVDSHDRMYVGDIGCNFFDPANQPVHTWPVE